MKTLSYKTLSANKENANKRWYLVDLDGEVLGRAASKIAKVLRGKYKTNFTPHADCGDYVVIINANKFKMTGNKMTDREIFSYTGYPGGQKIKTAKEVFAKSPSILIEKAVKGMLPKNKLGAAIFKNLRVYNDENHNQNSQNPESININEF